jgi:beta-glucosidase
MATQEMPKTKLRASDFPDGFLWGVATAAYQVEGAWNSGGRGPSIWDTFSHTPGKTRNGDNGDVAVDHYHRYREDVELMADIRVNAYRFSISWSRLIPDGTGYLNPEGVAFYRDLCEALLEKGIEPAATLYHWDLPQALQDRGGWLAPASVEWFADYAARAKEELGDLVQIWSTFNEPWCSAFLGHSAGEHAPGIRDPASSYIAAHNIMLAHHAAVRVMRETASHPDDQLGIVLNLIPAWPADGSEASALAAAGVDAVQNRLFLGAVLDGVYPEEVLGFQRGYGIDDQVDLDRLASAVEPIDYLGVNYYNVNHIRHVPGADPMPAWPGPAEAGMVTPPGELTEMGWGVEPEGLTWTLERVHGIRPGLPLMIMENGAAYPDRPSDNGEIEDTARIEYISSHIGSVHEAMQRGVNVVGYFVWSLLDNFEWARGYSKLFGIVHVDRSTMTRSLKASGRWYREFLAS